MQTGTMEARAKGKAKAKAKAKVPAATPTAIIGGGLTGIAAALALRRPYRLFERSGRLGGLARTDERDGFFFDRTGHWLHLRDPKIKKLVTRLLGKELGEIQRRARIFSNGVLTRYPFQGNLYGLPPAVIAECLLGFVQAQLDRENQGEPENFEQYIKYHFGAGIARHFMLPYNSKLWGVPPCEITSRWCSRFVPRPDLKQVIEGAVAKSRENLGYNTSFLYPRQGGIETLTRALVGQLDDRPISLSCAVEEIDPKAKTLKAGGETFAYREIIASIPLPALVGLVRNTPDKIRAAAQTLRATPVRYLNVATRVPALADYHWVYVPDPKLPFYRVGVFSNVMPSMAPPGCSNFYVELASRAPIADRQLLIDEALQGLVMIGAISSKEDVLFAELREIDPAYVIFDEHYDRARQTVHSYLERQHILVGGRYGDWIYNAMEDSLLAGMALAKRVNGLVAEEKPR